ncbi:hypothetical protein [Roseovarius indicus]|uniref:hypothetical protein n=2 Tax=Roseovarius indicus TaxID=540747 RepID=UPI0007DA0B7F|nr:hypothetical protein [Roseovarius indicus]OAO01321.1 hypothetical protein A8B76_20035 [Roseovarius indicus]
MILLCGQSQSLTLKDAENFRAFDIQIAEHGPADPMENEGFAGMAEPAEEPGHYWIDAEKVVGLSAHADDPVWKGKFHDMLKAVEKYGYSDLSKGLIKAHVKA